MASFVAVAGATGQLGQLVAAELRKRNASVKALIRKGTAASRTAPLREIGVAIAEVDMLDAAALETELRGASCVVSTLNGLRDVIIDAQSVLLGAAVAVRVPRFIPSDFSLDFTKTKPGSNRNLDLRREFHAKLDASGISWTSVLNGGFMELLTGEAPLVNHARRTVLYVGSAEQKLDFTTVPNTAAYTAAAACDPTPTLPRFLRIAGDSVSAADLARVASKVNGRPYKTQWVGSVGLLEGMAGMLKMFGGANKTFPAWQGMQYMANMFSGAGKLEPLDNDRYPDVKWTKVDAFLKEPVKI